MPNANEVLDRMYGQISALEYTLGLLLGQATAQQREAIAHQLQTIDVHVLYSGVSDSFEDGFARTNKRLVDLLPKP